MTIHFRVMRRNKFYNSIEEMLKDLDGCLITYNSELPHKGRNMNDRTPADVFDRCLPKPKKSKEDN